MADAEMHSLEAKCFCGACHFTFDVPRSALPLTVQLCHCSRCRYSTGAPCSFPTVLPMVTKAKFVAPSSDDNMTAYVAPNVATSFNFCKTCGCLMGAVILKAGSWVVSASVLTDQSPEVLLMKKSIFSKSAIDGGIAPLLPSIGECEMEDWNPPAEHPTAQYEEQHLVKGEDGSERLRAQCHCGGVSFTIGRPTQKVLDDEYMSRFVSPVDKTKWLAALDLCSDCRLISGTHTVGWAFTPLSACEPAIGPDLKIGTAKTHKSSDGVLRTFCETCGATVFYSHEDRAPTPEKQVVNTAVGLLRAPEGYMAENWLTWRTNVGWLKSGERFDKDFSKALQDGMRKWTLERYGKEINVKTSDEVS